VAWLEQNAGPAKLAEPAEAELRTLMNMATAEEMGDLEFEARRDLPSFKDFPWTADWSDGKPELPEGFKVAIIGSGFSGLAMGVQLERLGIPYVLLERRGEPGGVWTINRYPDVRVDTISITYEFSFEKEHKWNEYFGRGADVRAYLDHISRKYGVFDHTLFNRDLKRATFDEGRNMWILESDTPDGPETIEANVIVTAVGTFANPRVMQFEGQESFEGPILHPTGWSPDIDLTGKRVAIIGNGSTGVQLLAPIAAEAEQVFVFQRTPQWISPREKYGAPIEPELHWLI
jgi:4-hydroxyacetophenone monooxygenase